MKFSKVANKFASTVVMLAAVMLLFLGTNVNGTKYSGKSNRVIVIHTGHGGGGGGGWGWGGKHVHNHHHGHHHHGGWGGSHGGGHGGWGWSGGWQGWGWHR